MRFEVMTLQQFLDFERNKSTEEIREVNPEVIKLGVAVFGYFFLASTTVYAGPFDEIGNRFFGYAKNFLYWGYLVMACLNSFKEVQNGDYKGIWKVIAKYGAAYGVTALLPWLFKEIDAAFSSMK